MPRPGPFGEGGDLSKFRASSLTRSSSVGGVRGESTVPPAPPSRFPATAEGPADTASEKAPLRRHLEKPRDLAKESLERRAAWTSGQRDGLWRHRRRLHNRTGCGAAASRRQGNRESQGFKTGGYGSCKRWGAVMNGLVHVLQAMWLQSLEQKQEEVRSCPSDRLTLGS